MAWYDTFIGRKPEDLDEKLNPAQSYFDHKTDSSREFTFKYERAYEDLEVVNRGVNLIVDDAAEIMAAVKLHFPMVREPKQQDICYATQNRQKAVKEISAACDVMLVVGSANSSNTVRLVDVALEAGADAAYRVDFAGEIDEAWLAGATTVGLTGTVMLVAQ